MDVLHRADRDRVGDGRGGAALSVRQVTGQPIKFVGMGEKLNALEPFYPERMASRILGMGDVLSLVEEARKAVDVEEAKKIAQAVIAKFSIGPSMEESSKLGPLVSAAQRDRVLGFIEQGLKEGAELVAGGTLKPI